MLFALTCLDKPNATSLRADTRPAHLEFIRRHLDHVTIAGPLLPADGSTPIGSLLVVDFPSRAEVERFAAEDPYARAGLFETVTIRAFRKVFPET